MGNGKWIRQGMHSTPGSATAWTIVTRKSSNLGFFIHNENGDEDDNASHNSFKD